MFKKTYRRYLRLKIYRQEKKIKKLWTYKHPNKLFVIGRKTGTVQLGYWKGKHYRNGEMFTNYPHKSCMFRSYDSAQWALKDSDLLYEKSRVKYEIIRLK
jgi:hypothetical protein